MKIFFIGTISVAALATTISFVTPGWHIYQILGKKIGVGLFGAFCEENITRLTYAKCQRWFNVSAYEPKIMKRIFSNYPLQPSKQFF